MKLSHASAVAALAGTLASCSANEAAPTAGLAEATPKLEASRPDRSVQSVGRPDINFKVGDISRRTPALRCEKERILFRCKTTNGKQISLCDRGDTLAYSFGKDNAPSELALSVPREQATTFQWHGIGRWMNYSVTIPNGNTKYTVFTSLDRVSDEHEFEAGVIVSIDDEEIARLLCKNPIEHNLEGVDLKQQ
jgi:hypothetical protein